MLAYKKSVQQEQFKSLEAKKIVAAMIGAGWGEAYKGALICQFVNLSICRLVPTMIQVVEQMEIYVLPWVIIESKQCHLLGGVMIRDKGGGFAESWVCFSGATERLRSG